MPLPQTSPRACIFDLDGTLVDSLRDIGESLNEGLELLGLAPRPLAECRYLVGDGMPMLCQRAIGPENPHLVPRLLEIVRARYRTRPLRHTRPYPGLPELVTRLRDRQIPLAVLSNKPHDMTTRMIRALWPAAEFSVVFGSIEEHLRKPDPTYARRIADQLGVAPADTWLIGDTPTDAATAARAGMPFIGVTWGFRTRSDLLNAGANHLVDHPDEIR